MLNLSCNVFFTIEAATRVAVYEPKRSAALNDPFVWVDVLSVVPFWMRLFIHTFEFTHPDYYLSHDNEHATWLRILEAAASIRFLKLCRYYEGAGLRARSANPSSSFSCRSCLIMVICFNHSVEVEYDLTYTLQLALARQNVSAAFLRARPAGVDGATCAPRTSARSWDRSTRSRAATLGTGIPTAIRNASACLWPAVPEHSGVHVVHGGYHHDRGLR